MKKLLFQLGRLMSVRVLAIGLTFVQTIVFTRVFGSELFGLLSFALSISALLILVLSLGLDQVLMRDIARMGLREVKDTVRWRQVWQLVWRAVLPVTVAAALIGSLVVSISGLGEGYVVALIGALLLLPVVMARKYVESIALGTKQVLRSIFGSQIAYPLLTIVGGAIVWLSGIAASVDAITWTYVGASVGSLLVAMLLVWPTLAGMRPGAGTAQPAGQTDSTRALLVSGGHFAIVSLGFVLTQHVDVLLTGTLADPHDVALVRIASRIAEMAGMMRAIVVLQYKPMITESHGKADMALLQKQVTTMVRIFLVTGIPITLGLWIFAEEAMSVFGSEFVEGAWAMRIFVAGVFITLLLGPANSVLSQCNLERLASRYLVVSVIVQIVLDIILIPRYGAIGCAIANVTSLTILAVASSVACWRHLKIDSTPLALLGKK